MHNTTRAPRRGKLEKRDAMTDTRRLRTALPALRALALALAVATLPGLAREQLQIDIDGAVVRLQSTEGAPRQVRRAWELPTEIDAAASSAKLENGVLTLTLAKRIPAPTATRLAID